LTRRELARTAAAQERSEKIFRQQLEYSFLASKIEALNTAKKHYTEEYDRLRNTPRFVDEMREAQRKVAECKWEIESVLAVFRNINLD